MCQLKPEQLKMIAVYEQLAEQSELRAKPKEFHRKA